MHLLQAGHHQTDRVRSRTRAERSARRHARNQQLAADLFGLQQVHGIAQHGRFRQTIRLLHLRDDNYLLFSSSACFSLFSTTATAYIFSLSAFGSYLFKRICPHLFRKFRKWYNLFFFFFLFLFSRVFLYVCLNNFFDVTSRQLIFVRQIDDISVRQPFLVFLSTAKLYVVFFIRVMAIIRYVSSWTRNDEIEIYIKKFDWISKYCGSYLFSNLKKFGLRPFDSLNKNRSNGIGAFKIGPLTVALRTG